MKPRHKTHNTKYSNYKTPSGGGGGGGARVPGRYDEISLAEEATWLHFPALLFPQQVWDGEAQRVVEVERPWYEYRSHFSRSFGFLVCTAGAYKDKPCWPCAFRAQHSDAGGDWESAPYGNSRRFALSATICEPVYNAPIVDRKGEKVRNRKTNAISTRWAPMSHVHHSIDLNSCEVKFGKNVHMSLSANHLDQFRIIADKCGDFCRGCASPLAARTYSCSACDAGNQPTAQISGGELDAFRASRRHKCTNCGAQNTEEECVLWPETYCENPKCGIENPQGDISDFELLLRKAPVGDNNNWNIDFAKVRLKGASPELENVDYLLAFEDLMQNPLDVKEIFSSYTLKDQEYRIPRDKRVGLDATYGAKVREEDSNADEDTDDIPY